MMKNFRGIFWKVVIGFGIVACLLASTYWVAYEKLNILKANVESLAMANPKYTYRNKIINNINEIDSDIKKYTISKDGAFLKRYDNAVSEIGFEMDALYKLTSDDPKYIHHLDNLGSYINEKLAIASSRVSLANDHSSDSGFSEVISQISAPESSAGTKAGTGEKDTIKRSNFFSRLFSRNKTNEDGVQAGQKKPVRTVVSASKVKSLLEKMEQHANEESALYLKHTLALIERDDVAQDSIRAESAALEQWERTESMRMVNKLTDETSSETSGILTMLIISGVVIMLLFCAIVYREVQHNNRLRKELMEEKKSTERLAKAKEEFLANMSHEIRTPLNVIAGFSEQLLKTKLDVEQQNLLLNVRRSSQHLIHIINEILDYSKIESGAVEIESIVFNVEDVMKDVFVSFNPMAQKKGIVLEYKLDEKVSRSLIGDPMRLKQVLFNLVGNAIKFTEKGSVRFNCRVAETTKASQILLFEVIDSGIGISEESRRKIFDQFTQADSSVTRKFGGTGLGLAISKKLVELQSGRIDVSSEYGKGAKFHFILPYRIAEEEIHFSPTVETLDTARLKGKSVLIADDEEMNKLLAKLILQNCEMIIDTASNGIETLEKLATKKYDVVLMDLHMPEMGGLEAVIKMRAQKNSTPVIAVTGNVLKGEREKCLKAGMNDYIAKPYKEVDLLHKIINSIG